MDEERGRISITDRIDDPGDSALSQNQRARRREVQKRLVQVMRRIAPGPKMSIHCRTSWSRPLTPVRSPGLSPGTAMGSHSLITDFLTELGDCAGALRRA